MRRLLIVTLLFAAALTARASNRHVAHRFETSVPLRGIRRVVIEIPAGEIHLRNGSANDIVASGAVRREYDDDDERGEAQSSVDDVDVEIYTNGREAIVRRHFGAHAHGWRVTKTTNVELQLSVPSGVDVEFETRAGDIDIDGTFGNIDTDLRAGEIHVRTPRANVKELNASCRIGEVHTALGDRRIDREGVFPGTTHFVNPDGGRTTMNLHTTVGEVHVTLTK
jgi:DUF4097 and DUF4098 domain-containing protein YvlB